MFAGILRIRGRCCLRYERAAFVALSSLECVHVRDWKCRAGKGDGCWKKRRSGDTCTNKRLFESSICPEKSYYQVSTAVLPILHPSVRFCCRRYVARNHLSRSTDAAPKRSETSSRVSARLHVVKMTMSFHYVCQVRVTSAASSRGVIEKARDVKDRGKDEATL